MNQPTNPIANQPETPVMNWGARRGRDEQELSPEYPLMNQPTNNPVLRTIKDAVKVYGIPRTKLYNELRAGRIQAKRCGKRTLIIDASLRSYVAALPAFSKEAA